MKFYRNSFFVTSLLNKWSQLSRQLLNFFDVNRIATHKSEDH